MKFLTQFAKIVSLTMIATLFLACPTQNEVDSSARSYSPATGGTTSSTSVAAIVSAVKAQSTACSGGGSWIDVNINTSSIASTSTITVDGSSNGTPLSGTVSDFYIGVSVWNDIMIVCKMSSGAFNVTVSMCPYSPIVTTSRSISKFVAPYGITVADSTCQGMGSILAAKNTYIYVEASGNYQATWFGPTTFYPVKINCK